MGCDIHMFIELKIDNEWLFYAEPNVYRNYDLFSKMANVRNYNDNPITPISQPKGLPVDISKMVFLIRERWGIDGHSDSWLSFDEILILNEWIISNRDDGNSVRGFTDLLNGVYLFGNFFESWKKYPDDFPDFIQDIRVIFWFDN